MRNISIKRRHERYERRLRKSAEEGEQTKEGSD